MIYTIKQLEDMFPGDWGINAHCYWLYIEGDGNPRYTIKIIYSRKLDWFTLIHYYDCVKEIYDIEVVKKFYKTHAKLKNFK